MEIGSKKHPEVGFKPSVIRLSEVKQNRSKFEENRPKIRSFLGPVLGPPARLVWSQKLGSFCDTNHFAVAPQIVVDQTLSSRDLARVLSPIGKAPPDFSSGKLAGTNQRTERESAQAAPNGSGSADASTFLSSFSFLQPICGASEHPPENPRGCEPAATKERSPSGISDRFPGTDPGSREMGSNS